MSALLSARSLPFVFALSHFASTLLLSLVNHHSTHVLLALPFLQYLLTAVAAALLSQLRPADSRVRGNGAREGGLLSVMGVRGGSKEVSRRAWKIAAMEVVGTVFRVTGSRFNKPWIWATIEIYTPFLVILLPRSTPISFLDSHYVTARFVASAAISVVVGLTLWRTEAVTFEGIFLTSLGVACEAWRQLLVEEDAVAGQNVVAQDDEGWELADKDEGKALSRAFGLLWDSSIRSMALVPVVYILAFVVGLQDAHRGHPPIRLAGVLLLPVVSAVTTSALTLSITTGFFDFFTSSFAYNASNALRLACLLAVKHKASQVVRVPLMINCIASAAIFVATYGLPALSRTSTPGFTFLSSPTKATFFSFRNPYRLISAIPVLVPLLWIAYLLNTHHTVNLVIAHYSMPIGELRHFIERIKEAPLVRSSRTSVIIYEKGSFTDDELWKGLAGVARPGWDEIMHLPNYGREGGTYLEHITQRYNYTLSSSSRFSKEALKQHGQRLFGRVRPIADHTLFLQSHLAWDWIADGRLQNTLTTSSGFVSFGPYLTNLCGSDGEGTGFYPGLQLAYERVMGKKCVEGREEDRVLSTWAGQFAASRERVMANSFETWEELRRVIEAPNDDPIHGEWNPSGPSTQDNPAFGHSIERSWPLLMHCTDPKIAEQCRDKESQRELCQCFAL